MSVTTLPPPSPPRLITAEQFLRMPDEGKGYELVDGRREKIHVSNTSSRIAHILATLLENFCQARHPGWVYSEGNSYACFPGRPDTVRRPDVSYIALARMTPEQYAEPGFCPIVPDLVVEVLSPNDRAYRVQQKIVEWVDVGVPLIWVIYPELRMVQVYQNGTPSVNMLRETDTLVGDPVLPGFSCPVAELFRLPGQPVPGPA